MVKPETSSNQDAARRRKHGYRGYPNNPKSGEIHWGSGFAGIGSISGPVGSSGILTERTRNHAKRKTEDEDTLDE